MEPKMQLKDTVALMTSENTVDQFKAEYYQIENRLIAMNEAVMKYDLNPDNSENRMNAERNLLGEKLGFMRSYLLSLQREAKLKGIEL